MQIKNLTTNELFLRKIGEWSVLEHQMYLKLEWQEEIFGLLSVKMNDDLLINFMKEQINGELFSFYEEEYYVSDWALISKKSGETIDIGGWKKVYKMYLFPKMEIEAIDDPMFSDMKTPRTLGMTQGMKGTASSLNFGVT